MRVAGGRRDLRGEIEYSARAQDGPQEMERNEATAKHDAWPSCAWLLLSFFPYPVGHPEQEQCKEIGTVLKWTLYPI